MKISNSKKQLAKIISENGGWRDGAKFAWFGNLTNKCWFGRAAPRYDVKAKAIRAFRTDLVGEFPCGKIPNWHQTVLLRDEYLHLYPATDAVAEEPEHVWTNPPTIEQLAAEYRNRKDYAERKQQEADEARAEAEAKLAELVAAGKAVGLVLSVAEPEPELVITDWRDLQEGDEVEVLWAANPNWVRFTGKVISVVSVGVASALCSHGGDFWNIHEGTKWRFIRRPAKEADNA